MIASLLSSELVALFGHFLILSLLAVGGATDKPCLHGMLLGLGVERGGRFFEINGERFGGLAGGGASHRGEGAAARFDGGGWRGWVDVGHLVPWLKVRRGLREFRRGAAAGGSR